MTAPRDQILDAMEAQLRAEISNATVSRGRLTPSTGDALPGVRMLEREDRRDPEVDAMPNLESRIIEFGVTVQGKDGTAPTVTALITAVEVALRAGTYPGGVVPDLTTVFFDGSDQLELPARSALMVYECRYRQGGDPPALV